MISKGLNHLKRGVVMLISDALVAHCDSLRDL